MKKLKMQTPNITEQNIEQIAKLFPNVITEKELTTKDTNGHEKRVIKKAIDFDLLKQSLSDVLVDDENERYRLDWPGKKASLLKANTPITKTLRPCREESVNFDTTENLYIEGDVIADLSPFKVVFKDACFKDDKDRINVEERFKRLSPETVITVI